MEQSNFWFWHLSLFTHTHIYIYMCVWLINKYNIYIYTISSPNDQQRSPIHLVTSPPRPAPAEPPLAASQSAGHSRPPRAPRRCSTGRRRRAGPKWVGHTWRRIGDRFWMISMAKTGGQSIEIGTKHTRYIISVLRLRLNKIQFLNLKPKWNNTQVY